MLLEEEEDDDNQQKENEILIEIDYQNEMKIISIELSKEQRELNSKKNNQKT